MAKELEAIYLTREGRWFKGLCYAINGGSMGTRTMNVYVAEVVQVKKYLPVTERPDPTLTAPDPQPRDFTRLHGGPGEPVIYMEDRT